MFAQIIVDNKYIFAILHPLFADCTAGIRSKILQRRKFTCRSRNNGCITESSILFECLDNIGNGRSFLADCHINTLYPLPFLINNRVNCNRGLSGLTISDDQFSLSSSDRHHGINGFDTGLQWCIHSLSGNDTGCHTFYRTVFIRCDRSLSVNRLSERIHNTSEQCISYRHFYHTSGCFNRISLIDIVLTSEKYRTDIIFLQVQYHTVYLSRKF